MPVPTHLKDCVVPFSSEIDEAPLTAAVRCTCGDNVFELLYPGQTHPYGGTMIACVAEVDGKFFFVIKAKCSTCGEEHLLLDKDFHGWNGFVCHDAKQAKLPRPPLFPWECLECGSHEHKAQVEIRTAGKVHFISESDGTIDENRWPDGFSWFTMSTECSRCGNVTTEWVSYETM